MSLSVRPLVLLAATAMAVAASPVLHPSAASAAPMIVIGTALDVDFPRQVPPAASGQTVPITFTVSATEPIADVVITASTEDGGLVIANPVQSLGTLSATRTVTFDVRGATPGLHELFVSATSPSISASASVPNVWTSGSPLPGGGDELEPMSFGWQGTTATGERQVRMLSILDGGWAYAGLPAKGTPRCKSEGGNCFRYHYDEETDVLQVGTGIIGALYGEENPPGLYTEGLAAPQAGQLYGATLTTGPSRFADTSTRLDGRWSFSGTGAGLTQEQVKFKGSKFSLKYANGGKVKKFKGTFKLRKKGKITFRNKAGKVVQRGTVLVLEKASSEHGSFRPGIWLVLGGKKGSRADGNLLLSK